MPGSIVDVVHSLGHGLPAAQAEAVRTTPDGTPSLPSHSHAAKRNRLLIFAAILCAIGSVTAGVVSSVVEFSPLGSPTLLTVDPQEKDVGTVSQGDTIHATFTLRNSSSQPIEFDRVIPSCHCTTSSLARGLVLRPGSSTSLVLEWDIGAARGRASTSATILYQIGDEERLMSQAVTLWADVIPEIELSPREIRFASDRSSQTVRLRPVLIERVVIEKTYCTHAPFAARTVPQDDPNETEATVAVDFDRRQWSNESSDPRVYVYTNSTAEPCIEIPIVVERTDVVATQ